VVLFWGVALIVLVLDQVSKILLQSYLEVGESITVIGGLFDLTHVRNPGAAFGFFPYHTVFFIAVTVIIVLLIIYYHFHLPAEAKNLHFSLALLMGGAVGNLIDRISTGYVVDFLSLSFWPPVFNVADVAIVAGIVSFVLVSWIRERNL